MKENWITTTLRKEFSEGAVFLQVGSNDGQSGDPLYPIVAQDPQWIGVLVEPIPYLFSRLKETYAHRKGLQFENCLVSDQPGYRELYFLPESYLASERGRQLPSWAGQLGSLSKEHVTRHFGESLASEVHSLSLPCVTLSDLCRKHELDHLDVLHLDTEGHDFVILRSLSMLVLSPRAILFEQKHLTETEQFLAKACLKAAGYSLECDFDDVLALKMRKSRMSFWESLPYRATRFLSFHPRLATTTIRVQKRLRKAGGRLKRLFFGQRSAE